MGRFLYNLPQFHHMSYLIFQDFKRIIQGDNLMQVINSDLSLLAGIELTAQAECISYLVQKYITGLEFTDTAAYNPAISYKANSRVYLDALPYSATAPYIIGQLALQGGAVYVCNQPITVPEAFNQSKWIYLGNQYDIFYVGYPFPRFDLYGSYKPGDKVWWADAVYTCQQPTVAFSHSSQLQSNSTARIKNVVPNDTVNGTIAWGTGVAYSVPAGSLYSDPLNNYSPSYTQTLQYQYTATTDNETLIGLSALIGKTIIQIEKEIKPLFTSQFTFNTTTGQTQLLNGTKLDAGESLFILYSNVVLVPVEVAWVKGDNRNAQLLMYCCDIALYHIHSRIAPRNIPELRAKRYDDAIKWLRMAGRGEITPGLPVIQPLQGNRIRYSTDVKQVNTY